MASFRISLTIGLLNRGVDPATVLPAIADAVRTVAVVEAADLSIVRGEARVVIRFTAGDDAEAARGGIARDGTSRGDAARSGGGAAAVADVALEAARGLAQVTREMLTRRDGAHWVRLS